MEAADLPLPLLYRLIATGILIGALVERGETEEAARALAPVEAWAEEPAMGPATLRLSRARLRMAQGLTEDALADFLAVGDVAIRSSVRSPSILPWRSEAAVAHLMLGDRQAALALAEEDLALARVFDAPRALGVALRATGLATGGRRGRRSCGSPSRSSRAPTRESSTSARRPTWAPTCAARTVAARRASTCAPRSTVRIARAPEPSRRGPRPSCGRRARGRAASR